MDEVEEERVDEVEEEGEGTRDEVEEERVDEVEEEGEGMRDEVEVLDCLPL